MTHTWSQSADGPGAESGVKIGVKNGSHVDCQSVVAALAPLVALAIVGANPELHEVAREADQRLRRALASLETAVAKPLLDPRCRA